MELLATKTDLETFSSAFTERIAQLEGRVFQLEAEKDKLSADMVQVKKKNTTLRQQLESIKSTNEKKHNEAEQYSRRWNLRVFGIKETREENCVAKCLEVFNEKVKVETKEEDIQVAHRAGGNQQTQRGEREGERQRRERPPAIIVQFASRRVRDSILQRRRVLAKSGIVISEDLTYKNFKLLQAAQVHSATSTAWASNGKVIAQLKNGKKLRVDIDTDLNSFFQCRYKYL
nr:hypothetical protein BaRGS_035357 [Batillaria attramentaria]